MSTENQIILSDMEISYPSIKDLPKEQGSFRLLRLSQYPSRDKDTREIIEGEYTNCCMTSAFGKQAEFKGLPSGKTIRLSANKWTRNNTGAIVRPSTGAELTYWIDDADDDMVREMIAEGILYLYADSDNIDAPLLTPEDYAKLVARPQTSTERHSIQPSVDN